MKKEPHKHLEGWVSNTGKTYPNRAKGVEWPVSLEEHDLKNPFPNHLKSKAGRIKSQMHEYRAAMPGASAKTKKMLQSKINTGTRSVGVLKQMIKDKQK